MAVQTITYGDKSYLNENANIPATNKVQDTDMNEIKSVVNNNANEVQKIENYFNLNIIENITSGTITGGGTLNGISVTVASNSDGSLAKIYGQIDVKTGGHTGNVTFQTSLRPTSELNIVGTIYRSITNGTYVRNNALISMTIATDGKVSVPYVYSIDGNDTCRLSLLACLIFIKDFGDTPVN